MKISEKQIMQLIHIARSYATKCLNENSVDTLKVQAFSNVIKDIFGG